MNSKYLYIPIEVKVREFNAKLLLSLFAAESDFKCIIGKRHELKTKLRKFPDGIVVEKGLDSPGKEQIIRAYNLCGHDVAAIDEEGLVVNEKYYIARRIRKKALERTNKFFAWGQRQADLIYKAYPALKNRLVITGNARLDLLRKEFKHWFTNEIGKLKRQYGDFILINSAFALASLKEGIDEYLRKEKAKGFLNDADQKEFLLGQIDYYKKIFDLFCEMIISVSNAFPDKKIIVRPHPSEDSALWKSKLGNLKNVHVILEGNVVPWLLSAAVMIQNNCTTAIESYLLGKTPIAYRPVVSEKYDVDVTNYASVETYSINELLNLLKSVLNNNVEEINLPEGSRLSLNNYLCFDKNKFCCENIVNELNNMIEYRSKKRNKILTGLFRLFYRIKSFLEDDIIKNLIQPHREMNKKQYRDYKFPDTSIDEIRTLIMQFRKALNRFENITAEEISANLFLIKKVR